MLAKVKSGLKLLACQIVFYSGLMHLYIRLVFQRKGAYPAVIINYHSFVRDTTRVLDTCPTVIHCIEDFRKEIKFLKRYFDVISFDEMVTVLRDKRKFRKPTVVISVDDGYFDNFEILFPLLKEEGVPVIIFLTAGIINTNRRIWVNRLAEIFTHTNEETFDAQPYFRETFALKNITDKRRAYNKVLGCLKDVSVAERDQQLERIENTLGKAPTGRPMMLSWSQVRYMHRHNVSFGAHTCFHPILTNLPIEKAKEEIAYSKDIIEKQLGVSVKHFAYPNGRKQDFNDELREFCKSIGFKSVSTCDYGNNNSPEDVWQLKRIGSEVPISLYAANVIRAFRNQWRKE